MPDLIQKHFGYSQLWPLWPVCSQNQARSYYMPDPTFHIQLVLFLQRRPWSYCAKSAQIRSGRPGQVLAKHIWFGSNPVCKNHSAQFWQNMTGTLPLYQFSTFRLGCILPQMSQIFFSSFFLLHLYVLCIYRIQNLYCLCIT